MAGHSNGAGGRISWNPFSAFFGGGNRQTAERSSSSSNRGGPTLDSTSGPRDILDTKRRRDPNTEDDEESPGKKRVRRDSPLGRSSVSGPPRRAGSVKALNLHDSNARHSMRSDVSVASARSTLTRGTSTGLSFHINNLKLQTSSPTPGPEWSSLSAPKAGVSNQAYNVARPLGSSDMALDSVPSSHDANGRLSAQRGLTPTGATFGSMRTMLDNPSIGTRTPSKSPVSASRPIMERYASSGPRLSQSSVKVPRFGDSSLSRGRTTSLMSATTSAYTSSNASAHDEDRTTPTPGDSALSSPPVTSPSSSNMGSPPPPQPKSLPLHAQRALDAVKSLDTPLRHSFVNRAPMRNVKVPMPSKKSASYGRSSDAGSSRHSHSQSESGDLVGKSSKSEAQGHQRTASGPYAIGRDKAHGKKILDKRRAEEKELESQRSPTIPENVVMEEIDLHVQPIQKGKGGDITSPQMDPSRLAPVVVVKTTANRLTPSIDSASNSGTSSRTVSKSHFRHGREKTNHQPSASVTSASTASQAPPPSVTTTGRASSLAPSEDRTRIPLSEIPSRFDPMRNDRLRRAMSTGRFSLPPDDDDEDVGMANTSRAASARPSQEKEKEVPRTVPTLTIGDDMKMNGNSREKTPERESEPIPMNISPIKESYKRSDSDGGDMMSTTPTESSVRNGFSMTPIVPEPQAPTLPSNPFAKAGAAATSTAPPVSFGFTPIPTPAAPTAERSEPKPVVENKPAPFSFGSAPIAPPPAESKPVAPSPFSFAPAPVPSETKAAPSPFSFPPLPAATAESKPPALAPFSFGAAPSAASTPAAVETPKPTANGFSFLPAPGTTKPAAPASTSAFSFPSLPSTPAFPPASAEPAKKDAPAAASPFSFGSAPLPTVSISAPEAPKEAPKPFSFGAITPSAPAATQESKPASNPFSFGQPSVTATPAPSTTAPVSTTPATPSPVKPLFSFPSSTPAANPNKTPQSSPFSFGSESPSPIKPLGLGAPLEIKTPTKDTGFSFGAAPSTTPAATPASLPAFSFGNPKSTTPAATPAAAPFTFGTTTPATAPSTTPFTFGAPSAAASTTPAATPIQTTGFNFSAGGGVSNPFASQTTPTTTRTFNFGGDSTPAPSTTPSFSFGTPGDATPKGSHTPGSSFSFGAGSGPANTGFSFGAGPTGTNTGSTGAPGLVFPTGPTTPTTKLLELDSMDASPIRGGGPATTNGTSFSAANTGSGFSFGSGGATGNGFGSNLAPPTLNTTNSGFGAQNGTTFGSGFGREASPAPSPSTFSFGGNSLGSGPGGFGQPPSSSTFGQNASPNFGQNSGGGFSFSQPNSATSASPFNQAQALPSPALGGFGQLSSPASSPFSTPVGLVPEGSLSGGERKIAPMPRSRKPKTEAERRAALQKAHRG